MLNDRTTMTVLEQMMQLLLLLQFLQILIRAQRSRELWNARTISSSGLVSRGFRSLRNEHRVMQLIAPGGVIMMSLEFPKSHGIFGLYTNIEVWLIHRQIMQQHVQSRNLGKVTFRATANHSRQFRFNRDSL